MARPRSSGSKSHTSSCRDEKRALPAWGASRKARPGRWAEPSEAARGARNPRGRRPPPCGRGGIGVGGAYANDRGGAGQSRRAPRCRPGTGRPSARRLRSLPLGTCRAVLLATASASGSGCVRRRETGSSGSRRRSGAAPGPQPSQAPAASRAFLRSVLHASGACPAPEQQQQSRAPLERRRRQQQQHQRQPPEPPPQRGRGALGGPTAAATTRRQLPELDRPELLRGDEPQRALDAGAVLAQALLEPRQAQSLQPDLGSALRLRHGELGPPCPPSPLPASAAPARGAPTGPTVGSGLGVPGVKGRAGISRRQRRRGARGTEL